MYPHFIPISGTSIPLFILTHRPTHPTNTQAEEEQQQADNTWLTIPSIQRHPHHLFYPPTPPFPPPVFSLRRRRIRRTSSSLPSPRSRPRPPRAKARPRPSQRSDQAAVCGGGEGRLQGRGRKVITVAPLQWEERREENRSKERMFEREPRLLGALSQCRWERRQWALTLY